MTHHYAGMSILRWVSHLLRAQANLNAARSAQVHMGLIEMKDRAIGHDERVVYLREIEVHEAANEVGCFRYAAVEYCYAANDTEGSDEPVEPDRA